MVRVISILDMVWWFESKIKIRVLKNFLRMSLSQYDMLMGVSRFVKKHMAAYGEIIGNFLYWGKPSCICCFVDIVWLILDPCLSLVSISLVFLYTGLLLSSDFWFISLCLCRSYPFSAEIRILCWYWFQHMFVSCNAWTKICNL